MGKTKKIYVIKASKEREEFKKEKVMKTCLRAGASREFAREVADKVARKVYNGMPTREILKIILVLLKKKPEVAERYDLKRGIMNLGPSGYPFEKFIARVLEEYGYKTKVGKILRGKYARHEVDVIASNKEKWMIECKYHNAVGIYTGMKVALYTYARFLDLEKHFDKPWLVCNTKCSSSVLRYAKGVGLRIMSWNYPKKDSLENLISAKALYPVTILRSVNKLAKERFSKEGIVLAKDILECKDLGKKTGLQSRLVKKIVADAEKVVGKK